MVDPILVYRFADAPPELRALSTNGGDEDWLAVLPPGVPSWSIGWFLSQAFDAGMEPAAYDLPDGRVVVIVAMPDNNEGKPQCPTLKH